MIKVDNVVVGMGETGYPLYQLLSKKTKTIGDDINEKKRKNYDSMKEYQTEFLHICLPYSRRLMKQIKWNKWIFKPKTIVIHSTINPYFTRRLQKQMTLIPIIFSPIRGVHRNMLNDLKRYTKFFALEKDAPNRENTSRRFKFMMKKCGFKVKQMSNPVTLELAKIVVDTSYYGWLINYAQISQMLINKYNHFETINYNEMWAFADEIQKYAGNRPKLFAGYIGGHCVRQNLPLINHPILNRIEKINEIFNEEVLSHGKDQRSYS